MSEAAKNRRSFSMAYLLAQCAPPLKLPSKQPTAYSYNGVVLPKLPEVPGYDYSVMVMSVDDEPLAECVLSTKPLSYRNYNGHGFVTTEESDYIVFILNTASPREWGKFKEGHYDGCPAYNSTYSHIYRMWWNFGQDGTTAWANHDIYSLNTGERVIEKSDPIPVYE